MTAVQTAASDTGMVATAFPAASEAGVEMLRAGGTAVDAALAAAWALCVCEPSGSGLGGQSVLLIRSADGRTVVLDGHSRAPSAASRKEITRAEQQRGHRSTTVPTTVATLARAGARYGSLPLGRVLEPAIRLAEEGYAITPLQRRQLRWCRAALQSTPAAARFLCDDGKAWRVGDRFRQPRLAEALRRIARDGADDFYRGAIAAAIEADMARYGGLLDRAELAAVEGPVESAPLVVRRAGGDVLTASPPGGGGELAVALGLLERLPQDGTDEEWYVRLAQATHASFAERERRAERGLEAAIPSAGELDALAASIDRGDVAPAAAIAEGPGETTHLCAADAAGNVVSLTQSIQSLFGAKVANDAYGFFYNNYLTTCPRRRHRHRLRGGALARSNAVPTLVLDASGAPRLTLGAAGSRRIISASLHVLSAVCDRDRPLADALALPRVHPRLSRRAWIEADAAPGVQAAVAGAGFAVEPRAARSFAMGAVQAIEWRDGFLVGAADPRREGAARGC